MQEPAYNNPGIPPHTAAQGQPAARGARMYTPSQVALGTLLGGPMGLVYFLWSNFVALHRQAAANRAILWGLAAFVPMVILLMLSPLGLAGLLLTLAYAVLAGQVARLFQMPADAIDRSARHRRQSSARVVGIGLLCSLMSLALAFVLALALQQLGLPIR